MALTESANKSLHAATTSTTAETWGLLTKVREVWATNRDSTACFITVVSAETAAAAEAAIVTAVAGADESIVLLPNVRRCIFRSSRPAFVAGSIIGDASDYDIEGSRVLTPVS